jgi:peptidyl-prolyl cis-trans isomerase C
VRLPLAVALAITAGCATDAPKPVAVATAAAEPAMATVNGVAVPQSHMDYMVRQQRSRGAPDNAQTRASVREELINRELLAQEAQRTGIVGEAEARAQMEIARRDVLVSAYVRDRLRRQPITDDEIRREYERVRAEAGEREYRARHILVGTEQEAQSLIAQLNNGARFAELAGKHSADPGSASRGGDLDWNVPQVFDRAFGEAMMKLEKGSYTRQPVRTRFGFHIIQVDDVRITRFPDLAQARERIQQQLTQKRIDEAVRELRAKAKVE